MGEYRVAEICLNGHLINATAYTEFEKLATFCSDCGARLQINVYRAKHQYEAHMCHLASLKVVNIKCLIIAINVVIFILGRVKK